MVGLNGGGELMNDADSGSATSGSLSISANAAKLTQATYAWYLTPSARIRVRGGKPETRAGLPIRIRVFLPE